MKKTSLRLLLAALALSAVSSAFAQTSPINVVILEKQAGYVQTNATTPVLATGRPGGAYRFDVNAQNVTGGNSSGLTAPTVTLAAGSQAPTIIPGNPGQNSATLTSSLLYNTDGAEWRYGHPDAVGWSVGSAPTLNNLFASGAYSVVAQGNTYSLDLDGPGNTDAFFPGFIPTVSLTGGSWVGGKYVIDVSQTLTITTNSFSAFHTTGVGGLINIGLDGVGSERVFSRIAPASMVGDIVGTGSGITTATFTVAANTLSVGEYEGFAAFNRIVSQDTSQAGIFAVGMWANETVFTISAIPEPSTYAALAGVAALGLAIWRRRKTQAAA